jgi:hypothetical protein
MTSREPATGAKTLGSCATRPFYVSVSDCQALCLPGACRRSFDRALEPTRLRIGELAGVLLDFPFRAMIGYNGMRSLRRLSVADASPAVPNDAMAVARSASRHAGIYASEGDDDGAAA